MCLMQLCVVVSFCAIIEVLSYRVSTHLLVRYTTDCLRRYLYSSTHCTPYLYHYHNQNMQTIVTDCSVRGYTTLVLCLLKGNCVLRPLIYVMKKCCASFTSFTFPQVMVHHFSYWLKSLMQISASQILISQSTSFASKMVDDLSETSSLLHQAILLMKVIIFFSL